MYAKVEDRLLSSIRKLGARVNYIRVLLFFFETKIPFQGRTQIYKRYLKKKKTCKLNIRKEDKTKILHFDGKPNQVQSLEIKKCRSFVWIWKVHLDYA